VIELRAEQRGNHIVIEIEDDGAGIDLERVRALALRRGFATAAALNVRQGLPYAQGVTSPNRGALGSTVVDVGRYGSERYPGVGRLDWRIDRAFTAGRAKIVPALDVSNVLNASAVLARNRVQNTPAANDVTEVLAPRLVHLGARVTF